MLIKAIPKLLKFCIATWSLFLCAADAYAILYIKVGGKEMKASD